MPSANTVAELQVVVSADTTKVDEGLSSLNTKLGSTGSMLSTAFAGAAVAGVAALGAAFVSCVSSAADFEKEISAIAAVSGASSDELEALSATALQLGKDTSFSASEAAKGMEELVKAGVSIDDVMGGAAKAALDLAAAGAVEVADAAEIASNAMNVFNLSGADMAHVADQIAGAANASAIDVNDYKFSLSAAGAVAATVGIGFDDLTTAIAAMGNAGIKGSDAGTSLKTMLMNLQPSTKAQIAEFERLGIATVHDGEAFSTLKAALLGTAEGQSAYDKLAKSNTLTTENMWKAAEKLGLAAVKGTTSFERWLATSGNLGNSFFDASGKAKSMSEISEVLQNALSGLTEQEKLASLEIMFGSDAIRAAAVLSKEGAEGMDELAASIAKVSAQDVANKRLDNLSGSIEKLKGSLETGAILIGKAFTPALKAMVDGLTDVVNTGIPYVERFAKAFSAAVVLVTGDAKAAEKAFGDVADALSASFGPELANAIAQTLSVLRELISEFSQTVKVLFADTTSETGESWKSLNSLLVEQIVHSTEATLDILRAFLAVLRGDWDEAWQDLLEADQAHREAQVAQAERQAGILLGTLDTLTGGALTATKRWIDDTTTAVTRFWADLVAETERQTAAILAPIQQTWNEIQRITETIWTAVKNVLIAVWGELEREVILPALTAVQAAVESTWNAISQKTHEIFDPWIAYVRETIFGPAQTAVETAMSAASSAVTTAINAISQVAHDVLDPMLRWWNDTIWGPIASAVETAMTGSQGAQTSFTSAVNSIKQTVDSTMQAAYDAWMTMWGAIEKAAKSPADALEVVRSAVQKLKDVMPDWLIPHSPTPFEMGIRGIADAVKAMQDRMRSFASGMGDVPGELMDWIDAAIKVTGVSESWASGLAWIAMHESRGKPHAVNPEPVGNEHASGVMQTLPSTFRAYAEPGMKDIFNPVHNIAAAINYIQDTYVRRGRDLNWIIEHWASRGGYAAGGWAGLHGPELAWLGEHGPEYVVSNAALRSGASGGSHDTLTLNISLGGHVARQVVVEGYDLAVRSGWTPAGLTG